MATNPQLELPPATPQTDSTKPVSITLPTTIQHDISWVSHHIILLILTAILVFGGVYFVENLMAKQAAKEDQKWELILNEAHQQTQAIQQQLNQDEKNWAQINSKLLAENGKLASQINQRNAQAQQQIQQDQNLSAVDTASRLEQQTAESGEATAVNSTIVLTLPIGRKIVTMLDEVTPLEDNLAATRQQLTNETEVVKNLQSDLNGKDKLIAAMQVEAKDANTACKKQIADVKAQARKSKMKWFGVGFVLGFVARGFAGF